MRQLIGGAVGMALGLIILVSSLITMSGNAPKDDRNKSFRMGQYAGLATGGILAIVGGLYFFGQLYYMRDELFGASPRRRRRPSRARSRDADDYDDDPRRRRRRDEEDDYDDRDPRPRGQAKSSTMPLVIAGVAVGALVLILGVGGVIWFVMSRSSSSDAPPEAKALVEDLAVEGGASQAAVGKLIQMGPAAESAVWRALDNSNEECCKRAVRILGEIGTPKSIPKLERAMESKPSLRGACDGAIAKIKARDSVPASDDAKKLASDLRGSHTVAAAAMQKLMAMGRDAEPAVIPYLSHDDFSCRHRAAQVLEKIGTVASIAELERVIDAHRDVLGACQKAIKTIKEREGLPEIIPIPYNREEAQKALADLKIDGHVYEVAMRKLIAMGPAAEKDVLEFIGDPNFQVSRRAAHVLSKIGTAASLPKMREVVARQKSDAIEVDIALKAIEERERKAGRDPSPRPVLPPVAKIFANGPRVFLADLAEFDVKAGPWPFKKDGTTGDDKNTPIKVNDVASPKGLGMHPPKGPEAFAGVKYRLGKQAAVFKAGAGLDDSSRIVRAVTFTVLGDGKELSKAVFGLGDDKRMRELSVDVSGVDVLELRVTCDFSNIRAHAVWVEPRLLQRADTPDK